jgi:hypothetical protein
VIILIKDSLWVVENQLQWRGSKACLNTLKRFGRPAFGGGPPVTRPSRWAGEGKWSRPLASGCHGPIPFVETHCRASLQKAGPGSIALQRDLQSGLARIPLLGYRMARAIPPVQDNFFRLAWFPPLAGAPNVCMSLATDGTRPHPGGGSGRHRRPEAEVAVARGMLPPPDYFLFSIEKSMSSILPHPLS